MCIANRLVIAGIAGWGAGVDGLCSSLFAGCIKAILYLSSLYYMQYVYFISYICKFIL